MHEVMWVSSTLPPESAPGLSLPQLPAITSFFGKDPLLTKPTASEEKSLKENSFLKPESSPVNAVTHLHTERVDDIPFLFHTLQQMGIPATLDAHVPIHGNWRGISIGNLVTAWLTYILSEASHRMCEVEDWAARHRRTLASLLPTEWSVKDFTDDRLAASLRYLANDATWTTIEQKLGKHLLRVYHLQEAPVRLDTTTVSVYHRMQESELFRFGHSKDHRPGLAQFKLMLATLDPLGLPLATLMAAGNEADDGQYLPAIAHARGIVGCGGKLYVGDAKLSSQKNRGSIAQAGDYYLAPLALSGKIPELKARMLQQFLQGKATWERILPASDAVERSSRRPLALGFEIERAQQCRLQGQVYRWQERVLMVYSPSLARSQRKELSKRMKAARQELQPLTLLPGRGRKRYDDLQQLQAKVESILDTYAVQHFVSVAYARHVQRRHVRAFRGRPSRYEETVSYVLVFAYDSDTIRQHRRQLGWRLHATNAPKAQLSLAQAVQTQRGSDRMEHNFARLKGKQLGIRPLYVQREEHVVGMVRLLSLALRVLTMVEYRARHRLAHLGKSLKGLYAGNPKRATHRPTTERMLKAFKDITLTELITAEGNEIRLSTLTPLQAQILRLLGISPSLYTRLTDAIPPSSQPAEVAEQGGLVPREN